MSGRTYTVTVKLKDDGILKKLEALSGASGGSNGGGGKSGIGGGGNSIFKSLESIGLTQTLKLVGIGAGIGAMVSLMTKSSVQLQQVFKLWETGMTLVFRPLGDFIALSLKPMTMALLTQFIIPFYKHVYPFFRDYGMKVGQALVNLPNTIGQALGAAGQSISGVGASINTSFSLASGKIQEVWDSFVSQLGGTLNSFPNTMLNVFLNFEDNLANFLINIPPTMLAIFNTLGDNLSNYLVNIPTVISHVFITFGETAANFLSNIPGQIVDVFTGLVSNIANKLAGLPQALWDAIYNWVTHLGGLLPTAGGGGIPQPSSTNTKAKTTIAAIAATVNI